MEILENFLSWAEEKQWHIKEKKNLLVLPEEITERYLLPETWLRFVSRVSCCANPDESAWFLTQEDYQNQNAFAWNTFETISLESAGTPEEIQKIRAFWNRYFPVMLCVSGEYAFYAIDTENGSVVYGCEPEFEETEAFAESFPEFLRRIMYERT